MSTFLLYLKKAVLCFIIIVTVGFAYSAIAYANVFTTAQTVAIDKEFYYLVDESTHTQAVGSFAQLQGGAGYLLDGNTREYVAYSVYFNKQDGEAAKKALLEYQTQPILHVISIQSLVFKTPKEKRRAPIVINAFSCLDGCMQVLNREIARLDNGATQQSSKRILSTLIDQFAYLEREYKTSYPAFSNICKNAQMQLQPCVADIIYVKDLRYILCDLGVAYKQLSEEFAL